MINYPGSKVSLSADITPFARGWRNDPNIMQWCRQYTQISPQSHVKWLESVQANTSIKMFTVFSEMQVTDTLIQNMAVGVCGLTSIDHVNQKAEFSLYIAPEFQKLGLGRDALRTLIRHGFEDFNLNRIWGETYDGNPALQMFHSVGFFVEGKQRSAYFRKGKFIDAYIVGMLRSEFVW